MKDSNTSKSKERASYARIRDELSDKLFVQIVGGYALVNGIILLANAIELRRTVRRRMHGHRTNKPIDRGKVIDL